VTKQVLAYGDDRIDYEVVRIPSASRKVKIQVQPDARVQVFAPEQESLGEIKHAVSRRARWIVNHLSQIQEQNTHVLPRRYVSGECHFYLGRRHQLKVKLSKAKTPGVKLLRGQLQVTVPDRDPARVQSLLSKWYWTRAEDVFERRLREEASRVSWVRSNRPELKLLEMKKQWGSCSPKGRIHLNPQLVKAPRECIDYVILHELCHLKEHNHSPRFYGLLDRNMPEWRERKAKLDGMAEMLLNR
jgi:predicted metal-dependent hydrolase